MARLNMSRSSPRGSIPATAWALAVAFTLGGCGGSASSPSASASTVAMRLSDFPSGLDKCNFSGSIDSHPGVPDPWGDYKDMTSAWADFQTAGAVEGYYVVFSNSTAACAQFGGQTPPSSSRSASPVFLALNLVVKFKDGAAATADWNNPDRYFHTSVHNDNATNHFVVSSGSETGLGSASRVATRNSDFEGGIDYVAIWLNKSIEVELITFEIDLGDARKAALALNARIV